MDIIIKCVYKVPNKADGKHLLKKAKTTRVYTAKNEEHNDAIVLKV